MGSNCDDSVVISRGSSEALTCILSVFFSKRGSKWVSVSISFYSCCWTHPAIFYKHIFIKKMRFEDLTLAVSTSAKSLNLIIFVQLLLNTSSYFFYKHIFIKIMRFQDLALAVSTSAKSLNLIIFVQLLLNTSSYFFKKIFIKIMRFEDLALAVSTSAKSLNLIIFVQLLPSYFFTHMFSLR